MEQFIPTKFVKRLTALCASYDGTAAALQTFVDSVAASTTIVGGSEKHTSEQSALNGLSMEDSRDFFNLLAAIYMTGAQNNFPADKVKAFFQTIGTRQQIAEVIARSYQTHRTAMRTSLSSIGTGNLTLCDVSWRLDHICKDSEIDEVKEPRYAVSFLVQRSNDKSGAIHELTFFCNMQQLQEIIAKFKLALSAVERLASSTAAVSAGGRSAAGAAD